jgi:hypothetical protein
LGWRKPSTLDTNPSLLLVVVVLVVVLAAAMVVLVVLLPLLQPVMASGDADADGCCVVGNPLNLQM